MNVFDVCCSVCMRVRLCVDVCKISHYLYPSLLLVLSWSIRALLLFTYHTPSPNRSAVRFTAREDSRQILIEWTIPRVALNNYAIHITGAGQTHAAVIPIKISMATGIRRENVTQCGTYEVKLVYYNSPIINQTVTIAPRSECDLIVCEHWSILTIV